MSSITLIFPLYAAPGDASQNPPSANGQDLLVDVDIYIDSSNYFYYYYSFNYFVQAMKLDGISSKVESLRKLELESRANNYAEYKRPKIYLIIVYQRNLERYRELFDLIDVHSNLILWVIAPVAKEFIPMANFSLDATTSASSKDALLQSFRDQILPRILTLYAQFL